MKITFVLPVVGDAHHTTRIVEMEAAGADVQVFAFHRDYYPPATLPHKPVVLGHVRHGNYLRRLASLLKSLLKIRKAVEGTDGLYVFGLDLLVIVLAARVTSSRQPLLVYEIPDIREGLSGSGMVSSILRAVERSLLRRIDTLVVTSPAFVLDYLRPSHGIRVRDEVLLENKVRSTLPKPNRSGQSRTGPITIGYFGLLRCARSLEILLAAIKLAQGRLRLDLRGYFLLGDQKDRYLVMIEESEHVFYGGTYRNPEDLESMYSNIDLAWICYPFDESPSGNWKWARTNRFYESGFFETPVVASAGTQDGRQVDADGSGMTLNLGNVAGSARILSSVTREDLEEWRKAQSRLPKSRFQYTNEHDELLSLIRARAGSKRS